MTTLEQTSTIAPSIAVRQLLETPRLRIDPHDDDPRWQVAYRIAVSGKLGRSRLLARFLLFIVDRHIQGRDKEISEQQIGIMVFGRPEQYDSNEDNIVRSYARNLRLRLSEYYAMDGCEELLYLEVPRGGYTPVFTLRDLSAQILSADVESLAPQIQDQPFDDQAEPGSGAGVDREPLHHLSRVRKWAAAFRLHRRAELLLTLCSGIAIGLSILLLLSPGHTKQGGLASAESSSDDLWRQMFTPDRDTYVVPSDDGLVIMQRFTERPVPLASYISGAYRDITVIKNDANAAEIVKLGARRYTSVVDLDFVAHLTQVDAVKPTRMIVRYARDLRMDDLRTGNAVLIGSVESNPWIQIFEPQMSFRQRISTDPSVPSGFLNVHRTSGEREIYGTPGIDHTFGLIAFLPNLTSTGHILIVGGLNTAGTQAATTFLLTPSLMAPLLQHARDSHGNLEPFEVLIGSDNFASNASSPQVILERVNGEPASLRKIPAAR